MKPSLHIVALCFATAWLVVGAEVPVQAQVWLTTSEQEFIAALGLYAKINGKTYNRKPNYDSLADIGNRAPEPLKSRILALAKAYPKLSLSPQQIEEFQGLLIKAAEEAQKQIREVALEGATNPNLTAQERREQSAEAVNAFLEDEKGPFRTAARKTTAWYRDEAEARETVEKNLDLVTAEFEKRISGVRPASDLSLSLGAENGALVITGKVGPTPLTATVVQVVVHKAKANGSWQALDQSMSVILQSMGVSNLGGKAGEESKAQAAALEKSFNLPIIKTFGLPKLSPGSQITIDLDEDFNDVIFFERVSLKAWTAEGIITLDSIPSVEAAQKLREELPRDERFKDTASKEPVERSAPTSARTTGKSALRTSETPSDVPVPKAFGGTIGSQEPKGKLTRQEAQARTRRQAMQDQQALSALNLARSAIKRKKNEEARIYLNQVIALAPDSRAAGTAKDLLEKLDK